MDENSERPDMKSEKNSYSFSNNEHENGENGENGEKGEKLKVYTEKERETFKTMI